MINIISAFSHFKWPIKWLHGAYFNEVYLCAYEEIHPKIGYKRHVDFVQRPDHHLSDRQN